MMSAKNTRIRKSVTVTALLAGVITILILSSPFAKAEEMLKLKSHVEVRSDIVTIGDLFENARQFQSEAVFRSPALGREGTIGIDRIIDMADRYGLLFDIPIALRKITVSRPSRTVKAQVIIDLIKQQIRTRDKKFEQGDIAIEFTHSINDLKIPLHYSGEVALTDVRYDKYTRRINGEVAPQEQTGSRYGLRFAGTVSQTFKRPVIIRAVTKDDVIGAGDIEMRSFPKRRIPPGALTDLHDIIGMTPKQTLRAGSFVRSNDLTIPKLVKKNDLVTLIYRKAGMILKTQGKAIDDGAKDQLISVMNVHSKRIVQGIVSSHGTITVQPGLIVQQARKTAHLNQ